MKRITTILILLISPFFVFSQNLVSISPNTANSGQTLNVSITGNNTSFTQGSPTTYVGFSSAPGYFNPTVNYANIINDTLINANITVPGNAYTGYYNLSTTNVINQLTLNNSFFINGNTPPPPPGITSIIPSGANPGETLDVTITGDRTYFMQGSPTAATTLGFSSTQGNNPTVNSINVVSNTLMQANITVPVAATVGTFNAQVISNSTDTFNRDFFVYDNCLSYYRVNYDSPNNSFTLTIDSITSHFATSYNWDFGDGSTSTSMTPTHSFAVDSIYNVCLDITTATGTTCSYCNEIGKDTLGGIVGLKAGGFNLGVELHDGTTGIENTSTTSEAITIYPNPVKSSFQINTFSSEDLELTLYDVSSRIVLQRKFTNSINLNIESLEDGIYLYELKGDNGIVKSGKLIKN
ncbi:MAG: T9SS type A sorting domain-containing protein [Vicingaceae bacterium]